MKIAMVRFAGRAVTSGIILASAVPALAGAAGAEMVVDPGQQVTGSLTKDFNGVPVPQVEFSGGDLTAEVTGTISDHTLAWSLCVAPGDGSVRTGQ